MEILTHLNLNTAMEESDQLLNLNINHKKHTTHTYSPIVTKLFLFLSVCAPVFEPDVTGDVTAGIRLQ